MPLCRKAWAGRGKRSADTPELNQWLEGVAADAKERGYPDLFLVASDPSHPNGGGSFTRLGGKHDALFRRLRKALVAWEKKKGLDPNHDWRGGAKASGALSRQNDILAWNYGEVMRKTSRRPALDLNFMGANLRVPGPQRVKQPREAEFMESEDVGRARVGPTGDAGGSEPPRQRSRLSGDVDQWGNPTQQRYERPRIVDQHGDPYVIEDLRGQRQSLDDLISRVRTQDRGDAQVARRSERRAARIQSRRDRGARRAENLQSRMASLGEQRQRLLDRLQSGELNRPAFLRDFQMPDIDLGRVREFFGRSSPSPAASAPAATPAPAAAPSAAPTVMAGRKFTKRREKTSTETEPLGDVVLDGNPDARDGAEQSYLRNQIDVLRELLADTSGAFSRGRGVTLAPRTDDSGVAERPGGRPRRVGPTGDPFPDVLDAGGQPHTLDQATDRLRNALRGGFTNMSQHFRENAARARHRLREGRGYPVPPPTTAGPYERRVGPTGDDFTSSWDAFNNGGRFVLPQLVRNRNALIDRSILEAGFDPRNFGLSDAMLADLDSAGDSLATARDAVADRVRGAVSPRPSAPSAPAFKEKATAKKEKTSVHRIADRVIALNKTSMETEPLTDGADLFGDKETVKQERRRELAAIDDAISRASRELGGLDVPLQVNARGQALTRSNEVAGWRREDRNYRRWQGFRDRYGDEWSQWGRQNRLEGRERPRNPFTDGGRWGNIGDRIIQLNAAVSNPIPRVIRGLQHAAASVRMDFAEGTPLRSALERRLSPIEDEIRTEMYRQQARGRLGDDASQEVVDTLARAGTARDNVAGAISDLADSARRGTDYRDAMQGRSRSLAQVLGAANSAFRRGARSPRRATVGMRKTDKKEKTSMHRIADQICALNKTSGENPFANDEEKKSFWTDRSPRVDILGVNEVSDAYPWGTEAASRNLEQVLAAANSAFRRGARSPRGATVGMKKTDKKKTSMHRIADQIIALNKED